MKRIGVLQILQESNSFNPVPTRLADFEAFGLARGEEVLTRFGEVDEIGGFLEGLRAWGEPCEPVGLLRAQAWPGGPLSADTLQWFRTALRDTLAAAGRLDGVLLALHGALLAEGEGDVDGFLIEDARGLLGPGVPLVASLDLHGHCTRRMLRSADALVAYHTSPHLDRRSTGARAAAVLGRLVRGARPAWAHVRLPMISISEAQVTSGPVLGPVFARLAELERRNDILSASILMTQGWLDVPELGWSALVYADGRGELAADLAEDLARTCWDLRKRLTCEYHSARECVERALAMPGRPIVIADGADATNSGAGGDATHLLAALLARPVPGGALTIVVDPSAVDAARAAGEGGAFQFDVGGKRDHFFSRPLAVRGTVVSLRAARYVLSGHGGDNLPIDMGLSAAVRAGDVTLLLVERPGPGGTPMMYRCVGLEPKEFKIVVVKSPAGFRAEYEPFAAGILLSDCPGCASPRYAGMPYTRISRPLWPLDAIEDRAAASWTGRCMSGPVSLDRRA